MTAVRLTPKFRRQLNRLGSKYRLVFEDVDQLLDILEAGQFPGDQIPNIEHEVYKVRLPNRSAKKGKSGGFRVIYYVRTADLIGMLSIYVKSEQTDIPITEIKALIEEFLSDQPEEE